MGTRAANRAVTHAAIFDAAVALLDTQGYDETSVDQICERAGVGRATFFRHFDTKAGVLRVHNQQLAADARRRADDAGDDVAPRLRAIAESIHDAWIDAGPGLRHLGLEAMAAADPTGAKTHPELMDLVIGVIGDGLRSGQIVSELPLPLVAYLVTAHLVGPVGFWLLDHDADLRRLLDRSVDQALRGMIAAGDG